MRKPIKKIIKFLNTLCFIIVGKHGFYYLILIFLKLIFVIIDWMRNGIEYKSYILYAIKLTKLCAGAWRANHRNIHITTGRILNSALTKSLIKGEFCFSPKESNSF